MSVPIILDVDTGVDDACAVLLAALHPDLELQAVTCVGGNASVDDVVRNTLKVLDEACAGLPEIVFMGGAAQVGNATASAEFNVWHDPEAAAIVLETASELDIPLVMYGLDVFYDVRVSREQAVELIAVGGRGPAELAGRLIDFQCARFGEPDASIGDAGAVCAVIDRAGLTTTRLPVRGELAGTYSHGRTIVDRRDWAGDLAHDPHGIASASVEVALAVDADHYAQLWLRTFREAVR